MNYGYYIKDGRIVGYSCSSNGKAMINLIDDKMPDDCSQRQQYASKNLKILQEKGLDGFLEIYHGE